MARDAYHDYLADPRSRYLDFDDWLARSSKRPDAEIDPYKADKYWGWRDPEESVIEDLILGWASTKGEDRGLMCMLAALVFAGGWLILLIVLHLAFNNQWGSFTWEVSMDTGLIILFALCGTVLGSVVMWCVTTYKLRMAQLRERKEIRETEYNTKLLEKMEHSGGRLTMRELNR